MPCSFTRLAGAAAILLASATVAAPAPPAPPAPPAGPMPVPYPNPQPPTTSDDSAQLRLAGGTAIEVESFSWGAATDVSPEVATSDPQEGGEIARAKPKISDIPIVKLKDKSSSTLASSDPQEGGEANPPVHTSDPQEGGEITTMARKAGKGQQEYLRASRGERVKPAIPYEHSVASPRDVASGQATGKRQHKPLAMERGSLIVALPEGMCAAGTHYSTVTLQAEGQAYELSDVTVASCAPVTTAKGKKDKAKLDYLKVEMKEIFVTG